MEAEGELEEPEVHIWLMLSRGKTRFAGNHMILPNHESSDTKAFPLSNLPLRIQTPRVLGPLSSDAEGPKPGFQASKIQG